MPKVTKIEATINPKTRLPKNQLTKRKVAAYARVSTDSDEQATSYSAQVDYYSRYIKSRPDWEFVDVYTDEGISGTNTKNRNGFNKMIADALDGKIDLIITKSVSRFARNTVDSLVNIRKLKEHNVECYFEKENIYTFDSKGELLITLMSSLAQEESRSISENVTWGQRKRFADGKFSMHFNNFLGYKKGPNGEIEIDEEEAKTIRVIYRLYLDGHSIVEIAKYLDENNYGKPNKNKGTKWSISTVKGILTNEKYKGDALLQKSFTIDFLGHKTKKNEGEIPQYYVKNSHPAIIPKEEWEMVQDEMKRRKKIGSKYQFVNSCFSSKLICEDCGAFYGRKVWHSTDKGRKVIWQYNNKFNLSKEKRCKTPHLSEEEIKSMFMKAYFQLMDKKGKYIDDLNEVKNALCDIDELEDKIREKDKEIKTVISDVESLVKSNASKPQDQLSYYKKYAELEEKYNLLKADYDKLVSQKEEKNAKAIRIEKFIQDIKNHKEEMVEFNEPLWNLLVENAIVHKDKSITFRFRSGVEIKVEAEE